jgi:peroxiredoxin
MSNPSRTIAERTHLTIKPARQFNSLMALLCLMLLGLTFSAKVSAQLQVGSQAPGFHAPAALAGQPFEFDLALTLANGPVVVYFYPKAFTSGCTIEAQLFAQAMDDFEALNATVVGISRDDIETLKRFSEGPCGGRFAVAADADGAIIRAYDAGFALMPSMANRVSYAIAPDGTVLEAYQSMSPDQHVARTLAAIEAWHQNQSAAPKP